MTLFLRSVELHQTIMILLLKEFEREEKILSQMKETVSNHSAEKEIPIVIIKGILIKKRKKKIINKQQK